MAEFLASAVLEIITDSSKLKPDLKSAEADFKTSAAVMSKAIEGATSSVTNLGQKLSDTSEKQAKLGIAYEKAIISARGAADKTREVAEAIRVAGANSSTTTEQLNKLNLAYQKSVVDSQAATQKVRDTGKALTEAGGSTATYLSNLNSLSSTIPNLTNKLNSTNSSLSNFGKDVAPKASESAKKTGDAAENNLAKGLQKAGQAALDAGKKLVEFGVDAGQKAFEGVEKLAGAAERTVATLTKVTLAAGTAAIAAGGGALKLASDYESAFADLKVAISPLERTEENFKALEAAAVRVGMQTKFSSKEAALGLSELAAAGLNTEQSIKALDAVAQAAAINHVDMADAAKTMTVAMNAFGISAEDTTRIIDVQTKAANLGVMKFQDFQMGLAAGGAVAKMANQSFEDFSASLVVLTNNGLSASDAGTSMKSALLQLVSPGMQAQSAIDELGISVRDVNGNVRPFVDIIAQIEQNTKGMTKETKDFYLANLGGSDGVRAYASALQARVDIERDGQKVTLQGSEALRYFQDQLKNSGGSANDAAKILQSTLGAKIENLKGSLEQFGITLGTALLEPSKRIVDQLSSFVNKALEAELANHKISNAITTVVGKVETFAGKVGNLYERLSPVLTMLNPLKMGFEILGGVMSGGVAGGFMAVEKQVIKVGKVFGVDLSDPLDNLNILINERVIPTLKDMGKWFGDHIIPVAAALGKTFEEDILPALGRFGDFLAEKVFPKLGDFLDWFSAKIIPVLGKVVAVILDDMIPTLFNWWTVLADLIGPNLESVIDMVDKNVDSFKALADFVNDKVIPAFKFATEVIHGTWMAMGGWAVEPVVNGLGSIIQKLNGASTYTQSLTEATKLLTEQQDNLSNQLNATSKTTLENHGSTLDTLTLKTKDNKNAITDLTKSHDDLNKKLRDESLKIYSDAQNKIDDLKRKYQEGKIGPSEYREEVQKVQTALEKYNNTLLAKKAFSANFDEFGKGLDNLINKINDIIKPRTIPPMQWQTVGPDGVIRTSYTPPAPIQDYPIPGHAAGTLNAARGLAMIGERGAELVRSVTGRLSLVTQPTFMYMQGREQVFNATETANLLNSKLATAAAAALTSRNYAGMPQPSMVTSNSQKEDHQHYNLTLNTNRAEPTIVQDFNILRAYGNHR